MNSFFEENIAFRFPLVRVRETTGNQKMFQVQWFFKIKNAVHAHLNVHFALFELFCFARSFRL